MKDLTINERKEKLLKISGGKLVLAIEGRFTNLRIWKSKNDNKIRFRLDRANQYSAPLFDCSIMYLEKENKAINTLNKLYGFDNATVNDVDNILELTKKMKVREMVEW